MKFLQLYNMKDAHTSLINQTYQNVSHQPISTFQQIESCFTQKGLLNKEYFKRCRNRADGFYLSVTPHCVTAERGASYLVPLWDNYAQHALPYLMIYPYSKASLARTSARIYTRQTSRGRWFQNLASKVSRTKARQGAAEYAFFFIFFFFMLHCL